MAAEDHLNTGAESEILRNNCGTSRRARPLLSASVLTAWAAWPFLFSFPSRRFKGRSEYGTPFLRKAIIIRTRYMRAKGKALHGIFQTILHVGDY